MRNLLLLTTILILKTVYSQNTNNNPQTTGIEILAATSPEAAAAIEAISMLKQETSTMISDRHDQAGFASLNHMVDYGRGAVYESKLDALIDIWMNDDILLNIDHKHKMVVINKLKEYTMQIKDEGFFAQRYDLKFNDGSGNLFLMVLSFNPHPTKPNVIKWDKVLMIASFKPAPPYVIITESDCNLLSCDRTDRIEYLPAMLTDAHTHSILQLSMNLLGNSVANNMIAY